MYSPSRSRLEDLESNGSRWTGKRGKGSMLSSGKSVRRLMIFFVMCVFCLFYWTVVIPKATDDAGTGRTDAINRQKPSKQGVRVHQDRRTHYHGNKLVSRDIMVEFSVPGLFVPAKDALNLGIGEFPEEKTMVSLKEKRQNLDESQEDSTKDGSKADKMILNPNDKDQENKDKASTAQPFFILIGVTSSCCQEISSMRRHAIRDTWGKQIQEKYSDSMQTKFVLLQPRNEETFNAYAQPLEREIDTFGDVLVLRGRDRYLNLRGKTCNLLKYFAQLPTKYTHLVKTDDDTWVRPAPLLDSLYEKKHVDIMEGSQSGLTHSQLATLGTSSAIHSEFRGKFDPLDDDTKASIPAHGAFESAIRSKNQDVVKQEFAKQEITKLIQKDLAQTAAPHDITESKNAFTIEVPDRSRPRLERVYLGCIENRQGFYPIRDPSSKWYISQDDLSMQDFTPGKLYVAGWGYVLSADNVGKIAEKLEEFEEQGSNAPVWFKKIPWEDVLIAYLLETTPEHHLGFLPAWRLCTPKTVIKHLDLDSPRLLKGLMAQEESGLVNERPIQCSSLPIDTYSSWENWRKAMLSGS